MILYLVGIFINIILLVFLNLVGEQWVLFPGKHNFNNFLASTLCVIYLFYNSMIILEIKNFATNLYRMFNASNSQRIVNIIAKKENEKNKES